MINETERKDLVKLAQEVGFIPADASSVSYATTNEASVGAKPEETPWTAEEIANQIAAAQKRLPRKKKGRAGFTTNKGLGLPKAKRKQMKISRRMNRG